MEFGAWKGIWGFVVALNVIKNIFVQLLVIQIKPKPKAESTSKSRGRRKNSIMKEDNSIKNSFELCKKLYLEIQLDKMNF